MNREEFAEQVIVLKVGTFRDIDCWVRFFSPSRGILTGFAFGGCKSRRRFSGCLDEFSHVWFRVSSSRTGHYLVLNEGSLLHRFASLHRDLRRLGMAVNCLKFLEAAHIGQGDAERVFNVFFQTLLMLDQAERVPAHLPLLFRARLTCEYGYRPDFSRCVVCGGNLQAWNTVYFQGRHGRVLCPGCSRDEEGSLPLSCEASRYLEVLLSQGPESWLQEAEPQGWRPEMWALLDSFVQTQMGLSWDQGRFRFQFCPRQN
jgi:DNA repair protein RecO (recombination protein O)